MSETITFVSGCWEESGRTLVSSFIVLVSFRSSLIDLFIISSPFLGSITTWSGSSFLGLVFSSSEGILTEFL